MGRGFKGVKGRGFKRFHEAEVSRGLGAPRLFNGFKEEGFQGISRSKDFKEHGFKGF